MMPQDDFAALIAGIEQTGMTRTEIAEAVQVSRNTIWRLAVSEVVRPDYFTCQRIKILAERVLVRHVEQKERK